MPTEMLERSGSTAERPWASALHSDHAALRAEVAEFRVEVQKEFVQVRKEIRDGDDATRLQMRVLHEDVIERIARLGEAQEATDQAMSRGFDELRARIDTLGQRLSDAWLRKKKGRRS